MEWETEARGKRKKVRACEERGKEKRETTGLTEKKHPPSLWEALSHSVLVEPHKEVAVTILPVKLL